MISRRISRIKRRQFVSGGLTLIGSLASGIGFSKGCEPVLEGYTDQLSVQAGEEIGFCISSSAKKYSIAIARVGKTRQVVWTKEDLPGLQLTVPEDASSNGCGWPLAMRFRVPKDWKSGYYSVIMWG